MVNHIELWNSVLGELELIISKANFTTWFKNTFISRYDEEIIIIAVPNTFTKAWLEKKYHDSILKALNNVTQCRVKEIIYKVENFKPQNFQVRVREESASINESICVKVNNEQPAKTAGNLNGLNRSYRFDNFITGKGNELAHAACMSVANSLGKTYNPLFIYGGVGLGKTHLLQAIGNYALDKNPKMGFMYVTSEKFTNDYIQSVKQGQAKQFKDRYRSTELLLIDDIQFIAGKESTQEEFFHTFNALHQESKQIVLSSDRPPKAISSLEQRLLSRFEWGMIADVAQPDLETRIAILEAKTKEKNFQLRNDVINYIASNIQHNIRELEGALNQVIAYHQLNQMDPTLENVQRILSNLNNNYQVKSLTPKELMIIVASYFGIEMIDLIGKSRRKELVVPRQIAMYLLREELSCSYPAIGDELGKRDHTTAMHAYSKISKEVNQNKKIQLDINSIRQQLVNHTA